ncbi:MAG: DUF2249 domain-containing protein [bacterium]
MSKITDPELLESEKIDVLDVRPIIADGREPFQTIMDRLGALEEDQTLVLVAPFNPRPLKQYVRSQGYVYDFRKPEEGMTWMSIYQGEEEPPHEHDVTFPTTVIPVPGGMVHIVDLREVAPGEWSEEVQNFVEEIPCEDRIVLHCGREQHDFDRYDEFQTSVHETEEGTRVEMYRNS